MPALSKSLVSTSFHTPRRQVLQHARKSWRGSAWSSPLRVPASAVPAATARGQQPGADGKGAPIHRTRLHLTADRDGDRDGCGLETDRNGVGDHVVPLRRPASNAPDSASMPPTRTLTFADVCVVVAAAPTPRDRGTRRGWTPLGAAQRQARDGRRGEAGRGDNHGCHQRRQQNACGASSA